MSDRAWPWAESLGHWALGWTVVVVLVAAWLRFGRPRRASVRYLGYLLATFAGVALLPVAFGLAPRVSWREALARALKTPTHRENSPAAFRSWFEGLTSGMSLHETRFEKASTPSKAAIEPPVTPPRASAPRSSVRDRAWVDGWLLAALAVWGAGFGVFAGRLAWAAARVRAMVGQGEPSPTPELIAELDAARRVLGLRRRIRILMHPDLGAPVCVGLLRPTFLWPIEANCPMSPAQRRAALAHELAHLKHLDDWVALLAEAWRALAWFYPPVHWASAGLRREREYRCDDVALRQSGSLESYAGWLLDLAPVRVVPSAFASSWRGGVDLSGRIRRILDGEPLLARPVSRRQWAFLAATAALILATGGSLRLVGLGALAAGPEAPDAPLPAIAPGKLAEAIREAQKGYSNALLEAEFDDLHDRDFTGQGTPDIVKFPGRFQSIGDGRRWRVEYDSMMPSSGPRRLIANRWTSGFDGGGHYTWQIRSNEVTLGSSNISANPLMPKALFWPLGDSLGGLLAQPGMTVGQTTVDGVRCYVVKDVSTVNGVEWRTEFWVSPRQGHVLTGVTLARNGRIYATYRLGDLRNVGRGCWAPHRIVRESLSLAKDGGSRVTDRHEARVVRFEPDRTFAPADFQLRMPLNVFVNDLRLGYLYYNDPWWPEIGKLLLGHYGWPSTDLSPLQQVASHGGEALEGKEVPPIEAAHWINSGPLNLETLRGKVVLLNFTALAADRDAIPALRKLAEAYKPSGLEAVTILGSQDDLDDARQYVRELGIKGPVALDLAHEKSLGVTRAAFGMKGEVSTFLVDHSGDVHRVSPGALVETVVRLLGEAGAKDVKPLSATHAELTQEMIDSINRFWPGWREKADSGGKIVGSVVDGRGKPVVGAQVKATPMTYMASYWGAQYGSHAKPRPTVASGPDGRYVIPDLCKGNYVLDVTAPGLAAVERTAVIAPTPGETTLTIAMGQADSILGRLRDKEGRPLAGASVSISERHIPHPDGTETHHNGFLEMKLTDAEGRFRFGGLPEGSYSVEAKADGLASETRRDVQAGTADLEFTLGKSETPR